MNKMKKLLISMALVASLPTMALDFASVPFLASNTNENMGYVIITNNATVVYGATNVQYVDKDFNLKYSIGTNFVRYTFGTNPTNVVNGFPAPGSTLVYTNTVQSVTNYPLFGQAWNDVRLWSDGYANPATVNFSFTARCDNNGGTGSTNQLTVDIVRLPDGAHADTQGLLAKQTFVWSVVGITNSTFSTNLATAFTGGCGGFRLGRVATANSTTNVTGVFVQNVQINGFRP